MSMNQQALNQLRDIHLPEAISHWPLAPGWLILFVLLLILIAFLTYRYAKHRPKKFALAAISELEKQPASPQTVEAISTLLKRVALTYFPRRDVAGLHGKQWLEFLDKQVNDKTDFKHKGELLISAPYMQQINTDLRPLIQLSKRWIKLV